MFNSWPLISGLVPRRANVLVPLFREADQSPSRFGTQIGVTMVYTYATDAYKPQSGEIGAIINLFKSGECSDDSHIAAD